MGIAGITMSTSFVTLFNAIFLGLFIHRKIKLDYKSLFYNLAKMLLAGGLTLVAGWFICVGFDKIQLPKYIFEISKIIFVMISVLGIYAVLNLAFKMEYAKELASRISKKG
mgnify:FL=1